jgi:hypothetical protein
VLDIFCREIVIMVIELRQIVTFLYYGFPVIHLPDFITCQQVLRSSFAYMANRINPY